MKAELIAVGTEMLTGQIVDTNSQFLSEQFAQYGIDVYFHTAVGDNEERLLSVLNQAKSRSDLIVLCGGLGPTDDDLTKQVLAKFLGKKLVFDDKARERLDDFFASRPAIHRTPNNERQAQIIEGATPIQNVTGLAVGGLIEVEGVKYVVLPGPPSELKPMVLESLLSLLVQDNERLYSRILRFFGIGESRLVTILDDFIKHQTDPTIAPYAKTGEVTLRLSTKASSQEEADAKFDPLESELLAVENLEELCYGYGEQNSLAEVVTQLLKEKELTVTAAESLTGGLFQSTLTSISGASNIFKGGFVTYSNEEKAKMLDIELESIEEHGAVSAYTAEKMAEGARKKVGADFAVAMTGVAGPYLQEDKEVGTVFLAIASEDSVQSIEVHIGGRSRQDVREITVLHAFNLLRQALS